MPLCFSLKIIVLIKEHTHACMHTHTHTHAPQPTEKQEDGLCALPFAVSGASVQANDARWDLHVFGDCHRHQLTSLHLGKRNCLQPMGP